MACGGVIVACRIYYSEARQKVVLAPAVARERADAETLRVIDGQKATGEWLSLYHALYNKATCYILLWSKRDWLYNGKLQGKSVCCRCPDASPLVPRESSIDAIAAGAPRRLNPGPSGKRHGQKCLFPGAPHQALSTQYICPSCTNKSRGDIV